MEWQYYSRQKYSKHVVMTFGIYSIYIGYELYKSDYFCRVNKMSQAKSKQKKNQAK